MSHSIQPVLFGPGQHAEGRGVGDHDEIAGALHLVEADAAALGEHREHRAVRGVFRQQRRRHGDARAHRARRLRRHQRLAAQHAVLIAEREAHHFELAPLDLALDRRGRAALLGGPQIVAIDEALRSGARRGMFGARQRAVGPARGLALAGVGASASSPASRRSGRCRRSRRGR